MLSFWKRMQSNIPSNKIRNADLVRAPGSKITQTSTNPSLSSPLLLISIFLPWPPIEQCPGTFHVNFQAEESTFGMSRAKGSWILWSLSPNRYPLTKKIKSRQFWNENDKGYNFYFMKKNVRTRLRISIITGPRIKEIKLGDFCKSKPPHVAHLTRAHHLPYHLRPCPSTLKAIGIYKAILIKFIKNNNKQLQPRLHNLT